MFREAAFVKEFRASVTQRCAGDASAKDRLAAILADQHTGLIVSCRMVNLPGALVQIEAGGNRLLARITRRSVEGLALNTGQAVFAVVKAVSVAKESIAEPPSG